MIAVGGGPLPEVQLLRFDKQNFGYFGKIFIAKCELSRKVVVQGGSTVEFFVEFTGGGVVTQNLGAKR